MNHDFLWNNIIVFAGNQCRFEYAACYIKEADKNRYKDCSDDTDSRSVLIMPDNYQKIRDLQNRRFQTSIQTELIFYSSNLPHSTAIYLTGDHSVLDLMELTEDGLFTKMVIFDTFPYGEGELIKLLQEIMVNLPYMKVKVLIDKSKRRYGYTDMTDENYAISQTKEIYTKYREDCVISSNEELTKFIYANPSSVAWVCRERFHHNMKELEVRIENFDLDYELYVYNNLEDTLLTETALDQFCNYTCIKGYQKVLTAYRSIFEKLVLNRESEFYKQVAGLYQEIISPVCIWDMEEDLIELFNQLLFCFHDSLSSLSIVDVNMPADELQYRKLMSRTNYDVQFKNYISKDYLSKTVPETIKARLKVKYNNMTQKT